MSDDSDEQDGDGFDPERFRKKMEEDDLVGAANYAQKSAGQLDGGYHRQLYELLGAQYALADVLSKDPKTLDNFVNLPFFTQGGQLPPRIGKHDGQILNVTGRYVFGATTVQTRDRVLKASAAFRPYLEKKVDPAEIPVLIEREGGIERLYQKFLEGRREQADGSGDGDGGDGDGDGGDGDGGDGTDPDNDFQMKAKKPRVRMTMTARTIASPLTSRPLSGPARSLTATNRP